MSDRPGSVREVQIPKEGAPGAFRTLGISNFEDKIVQSMSAKILGAIHEPVFKDCSFGLRPLRNCHWAIATGPSDHWIMNLTGSNGEFRTFVLSRDNEYEENAFGKVELENTRPISASCKISIHFPSNPPPHCNPHIGC